MKHRTHWISKIVSLLTILLLAPGAHGQDLQTQKNVIDQQFDAIAKADSKDEFLTSFAASADTFRQMAITKHGELHIRISTIFDNINDVESNIDNIIKNGGTLKADMLSELSAELANLERDFKSIDQVMKATAPKIVSGAVLAGSNGNLIAWEKLRLAVMEVAAVSDPEWRFKGRSLYPEYDLDTYRALLSDYETAIKKQAGMDQLDARDILVQRIFRARSRIEEAKRKIYKNGIVVRYSYKTPDVPHYLFPVDAEGPFNGDNRLNEILKSFNTCLHMPPDLTSKSPYETYVDSLEKAKGALIQGKPFESIIYYFGADATTPFNIIDSSPNDMENFRRQHQSQLATLFSSTIAITDPSGKWVSCTTVDKLAQDYENSDYSRNSSPPGIEGTDYLKRFYVDGFAIGVLSTGFVQQFASGMQARAITDLIVTGRDDSGFEQKADALFMAAFDRLVAYEESLLLITKIEAIELVRVQRKKTIAELEQELGKMLAVFEQTAEFYMGGEKNFWGWRGHELRKFSESDTSVYTGVVLPGAPVFKLAVRTGFFGGSDTFNADLEKDWQDLTDFYKTIVAKRDSILWSFDKMTRDNSQNGLVIPAQKFSDYTDGAEKSLAELKKTLWKPTGKIDLKKWEENITEVYKYLEETRGLAKTTFLLTVGAAVTVLSGGTALPFLAAAAVTFATEAGAIILFYSIEAQAGRKIDTVELGGDLLCAAVGAALGTAASRGAHAAMTSSNIAKYVARSRIAHRFLVTGLDAVTGGVHGGASFLTLQLWMAANGRTDSQSFAKGFLHSIWVGARTGVVMSGFLGAVSKVKEGMYARARLKNIEHNTKVQQDALEQLAMSRALKDIESTLKRPLTQEEKIALAEYIKTNGASGLVVSEDGSGSCPDLRNPIKELIHNDFMAKTAANFEAAAENVKPGMSDAEIIKATQRLFEQIEANLKLEEIAHEPTEINGFPALKVRPLNNPSAEEVAKADPLTRLATFLARQAEPQELVFCPGRLMKEGAAGAYGDHRVILSGDVLVSIGPKATDPILLHELRHARGYTRSVTGKDSAFRGAIENGGAAFLDVYQKNFSFEELLNVAGDINYLSGQLKMKFEAIIKCTKCTAYEKQRMYRQFRTDLESLTRQMGDIGPKHFEASKPRVAQAKQLMENFESQFGPSSNVKNLKVEWPNKYEATFTDSAGNILKINIYTKAVQLRVTKAGENEPTILVNLVSKDLVKKATDSFRDNFESNKPENIFEPMREVTLAAKDPLEKLDTFTNQGKAALRPGDASTSRGLLRQKFDALEAAHKDFNIDKPNAQQVQAIKQALKEMQAMSKRFNDLAPP